VYHIILYILYYILYYITLLMERFLTSDRLISYHRNRLDIVPYPKSELNIAYLDRKYEQYNIHLSLSDDSLKLKALKEIYDDLQLGDEIYKYSIIYQNLLLLIFNLLKTSSNDDIRLYTSMCFKQFCKIKFSIDVVNSQSLLLNLHSIFCDSNSNVKLCLIEGLIYYTEYREGKEILYNNGIIEIIIERLVKEKNENVLNSLLLLLNELLHSENGSSLAINNNIISVLLEYINHTNISIRLNVFKNLSSLSMCDHGKESCIKEKDDLINKCIIHFNNEVMKNDFSNINFLYVAELTRFLIGISILKRGKEEIYKHKGLELGLDFLKLYKERQFDENINKHKDDIEQIVVNILQYIGNGSEDPLSRKFMLKNKEIVEYYMTNDNEIIKEQSGITLRIINWKP